MSDPYGDAEAARYDNPVASRRWILELLEETGRPLDYEELAVLTKTEEINREGLVARLSAMCRDGQVITDRIGRYVLVDKAGLVQVVLLHIEMALVFLNQMMVEIISICMTVKCEKSSMVTEFWLRLCLPQNTPRVNVRRGLLEVLDRIHQRLIGRLQDQDGVKFVTPEDDRFLHEILIPEDQMYGAKVGPIRGGAS